MINTNDSQAIVWNSNDYNAYESFDAWDSILNETYGSWSSDVAKSPIFSAELRTKKFGGLSVTQCICEPCAAERTPKNISKDSDENLAIQLVLEGYETMVYRGERYSLHPGDIFVWDSTQRMRFDVEQTLEKISVVLPLNRLKNWLPKTWHSIPRVISSGSTFGPLLKSHIVSLANNTCDVSTVNDDALSEATVALLVSALNQNTSTNNFSLSNCQLEAIKLYINTHLNDPSLSLSIIAAANRISLRYLHWLFSEEDTTASQYIISQRLDRCRRDLLNIGMRNRSISEVAYSWGFNDPRHFGRRFKEMYGMTPSNMRESIADVSTFVLD
jgi:AraC-like DNA-binding protein